MAEKVSRRSFLRAMAAAAAGTASGSLLVSCGGTSATPAAATPAAGAPAAPAAGAANATEVRFHARIGAQEDKLYDMSIPKFMAEHPDIKIVKESFPGAEYPAKISTLKAGNTLGDVMWSALGGALIQYHYGQKIIQPIDDLVKSQNVDLTGWYKGCLDAITIDGKLLGLPFKSHPGMAAVYYNQTALEAAGVAIPTKEWTIEQQLDMAKKLTKTEGDRVTSSATCQTPRGKAL